MIARGPIEKNVRKKAGFDDIWYTCEKSKRKTLHNILISKEYFVGFTAYLNKSATETKNRLA